jgi:CRP-like cAMP-binding protein
MSIKSVLRKKRISIVKLKEDQILDLVRDELDNEIKTVENPKLLFYFLSNTPIFKQYIYIHNFTQENLINSFRFGKYIKLKKDTILFRQGDKTDYFYLILSGCIGFILTTYDDIILKINPYSREVNSIRVGSYFGEWGFIYKINRTVSAYAKEDTLLLGFDKFAFKTFYQDNIILSENYSKKFVLKHIKTFKDLNETSFNIYYREIKKIYCIPGKEIFKEGSKANSFYLVYKGSCTVKKGLTNLIIKDSGDFIGIESLYNKNYENSIYPNTDGTVLFKFLLNSFNETIIYNLKMEFEDYYKNQTIILQNSYENYNKYKDKYQMSFINLLENLKQNKVKNNKQITNVKIDDIKTKSNIYENKHYFSPYKVIKLINFGSINKSKNNIFNSEKSKNEDTKFLKYLKYYNESAYNLIKADIKDTN